MAQPPSSVFVGVSGASGAPYALRLVEILASQGCELKLSISDTGLAVLKHELGFVGTTRATVTQSFLSRAHAEASTRVYAPDDLEAAVSSGSSFPDAAVICPCSLSTVAHIALGTTRTLLHRAGEVALKEGRPLVLVPRETPLSEVHLQRLLDARRAGAVVVPAMPAFYHRPQTVQDLIDHVVGKVMSALGLEQTLFEPWTGPPPEELVWSRTPEGDGPPWADDSDGGDDADATRDRDVGKRTNAASQANGTSVAGEANGTSAAPEADSRGATRT